MDCIFCQIAASPDSRLVYSDDAAVAFLDIEPWQPGHTVVVSRRHVSDLLEDPAAFVEIAPAVAAVAGLLVERLDAQGVNVLSNARTVAGQSVYHLHTHVVPRYLGAPGLRNLVPAIPQGADAEQLDAVYRKITGQA